MLSRDIVNLEFSGERSRAASGSAFPAVATPSFSDEPSYDNDHVGESYPEVDDPPLPLGTPEELLVGVVPGINVFDDPPHSGFKRGRLAFLGDHTDQATALQKLSGRLEYSPGQGGRLSLWQISNAVDGFAQKRRVVPVCRSGYNPKRDTLGINGHRAFDALFSLSTGLVRLVASTRSFGDAAIDGHLGEFQANDWVE